MWEVVNGLMLATLSPVVAIATPYVIHIAHRLKPVATCFSRIRGSRCAIYIPLPTDFTFNLETAIQDDKVMQDLDLESLLMGADHSL